MAFIYDETRRSTGRPKVTGGIPLDELGATGFGLAVAAEQMAAFISMSLVGARVAIQGFGNVGKAAAKFLEKRGCVLVAASDSAGAIYNPKGINLTQLTLIKENKGKVQDYPDAEKIDSRRNFHLTLRNFSAGGPAGCHYHAECPQNPGQDYSSRRQYSYCRGSGRISS